MTLCAWDFLGKNTGVGCHFLLQGIFPTQKWNLYLLCLLHCQTDSLSLNHLGSHLGRHYTPIKILKRLNTTAKYPKIDTGFPETFLGLKPNKMLTVKEETDRAGLHLRPGCEHQATQMATLPMHSELCVYRSGIPMGNQTPRIKEPQDLDLDSPLPKRIH